MMMHPDHYDLLMRICKGVAVVWILVLSYKLGHGIYNELRMELYQ